MTSSAAPAARTSETRVVVPLPRASAVHEAVQQESERRLEAFLLIERTLVRAA